MIVAFHCHRLYFTGEQIIVGDVLFQATVKDTQFDFSHVEPAAMLGGVVKLQLLEKAPGGSWRKGFVQ